MGCSSGFESWRHLLASIEPIIIASKRVRDIFFEFPILRNYINLTLPKIVKYIYHGKYITPNCFRC